MQKKFDNQQHPFKGAPIPGTVITLNNGTTKELTALDRVRISDVTDECLAELGVLEATQTVRMAGKAKEDIFHPQFVGTFDDLVALNYAFLLDNTIPVVNLMLWLGDQFTDENTTVEEFVSFARRLLAGEEPVLAAQLNVAIRHGWAARTEVQGGAATSRDFTWGFALDADIAALDEYVVKPVIAEFVADIESGKFNC